MARSVSARWPSCCRCWPRPPRSATSPGTTSTSPSWCRGCPGRAKLEAELAPGDDMSGTAPASGLPARDIRFEGVRFRYPGADHDVFDGLDLVIPAGRGTALVGINGAGKTTLVKLLARLHDPAGGAILVDGTDLARLRPAEWQRQVGVVFQDFAHYPLSASENIGLGAPEHLEDSAGLTAPARRA